MEPATSELESILAAAVEIPCAAERQAYVARACAGDSELRHRVEQMVEDHFRAGSFLESPAPTLDTTLDERMVEHPGTVIGPYSLLEQIGEGGMGTVWMAQQTEPVKRLVALKLIKAGMDSRQVIARFEAERQALALMDHPNIARVLDAGTSGAGLPYFVMELVKGVPITKYCDEHHLTPRQRLELFIPVCQAIQHAHQKGIIHRDLKPSNVLVALYDGRPVVKVIDFGVAKAIGTSLTEETLHTGFGAVIGTLEYMSPEQANLNQFDVDTRSDIYGLGVLLYELLTGATPLEHRRVKEKGVLEALRIIREEEAPTLSNRLSTTEQLASVAARRGLEPAKLSKLVRGELDWIVMKALAKDRNRRYETANAFALDVGRYLADEPVQAGPPSAAYRLRKFVQRNRAAITVATLLILSVLVAAGAAGWEIRCRAARLQQIELERDAIVGQAQRLRDQGQWPQARATVAQARELFSISSTDGQRRRLEQVVKDLDMVARVEAIRIGSAPLGGFTPYPFKFGPLHVKEYAEAFREYGIDVLNTDVAVVADQVRMSAICDVLVAALDDWMWGYQYAKPLSVAPNQPTGTQPRRHKVSARERNTLPCTSDCE